MGKHAMKKPSLFRRVFFKTWEVTSDTYIDVDRFRTRKGARTFADEMNKDYNSRGEWERAYYKVNRRSFKKEEDYYDQEDC